MNKLSLSSSSLIHNSMKIYLSAYSLLWNNHQLRTGSASPLAKEKTFTLPPYAPLPGYQWEPLLSDSLVEDNNSSNSTRLENLFNRVIEELLKTSGFNASDPRGCFIFSSTKGNIDLLRGAEPEIDSRCFLGEMAERICRRYDAPRPIVISNACISGSSALIVGARLLQAGLYNHIFVLGGDLLNPFVFEGFKSFKALSTSLCHPFDISHDGLTLGEACAGILLTRRRYPFTKKGDAYFTLLGGAMTDDANHISAPSRTGDGLYYAIRAALGEAGLQARDVDFVSAHGTATVYNDEMESKAFNLAGLAGCPLNSLKPYFGHTLGACGVIESILAAWQLRHSTVFATPGYEECGVPYPLSVSSSPRRLDRSINCLKTASGFAGCNAAIVFSICGKENNNCSGIDPDNARKEITCIAESELVIPENKNYDEYILEQFRALDRPDIKFYKMDRLSKAAYIAAEKLLKGIKLPDDRTKVAVVLYNRSASLDTDLKHQATLDNNEAASPAVFVYTLPNIMCGEICIRHKINGENTFFVQDGKDGFPLEYARLLLEHDMAEYVIYGENDVLGNAVSTHLQLLVKKQ